MTFNHINRRIHLYLGLILLSWCAVYGLSSFYINHPRFMEDIRQQGNANWTTTVDRSLDLEVAEDTQPHELARRVLDDLGLEEKSVYTRFFGQDQQRRLFIVVISFLNPVRINYFINTNQVRVEESKFSWRQLLISLHLRGGYQHDSLLMDAWAVIVDIFCIGMLVWIASGIIIWWQMKQVRTWGLITLSAGLLTFIGFMLGL